MKRTIGWALGVCLVGGTVYLGLASSHREAPLISADPLADNTDIYAFVSPDAPNTVTLIANWIPLEAPAADRTSTSSATTSLYRINVDNDGDAQGRHRLRVPVQDPHPEPATPSSTTPARSRRSTIRTSTCGRPTRSRGSIAAAAMSSAATWRRRRSTSGCARRRTTRRSATRAIHTLTGRLEGVRRPARRSVLRRSRLGVRPARPAAVQLRRT